MADREIDKLLKDYDFEGAKADGVCMFCGKSGVVAESILV